MDVPVADAVQALNLAVTGLLPPPASPELAPEVLVNPVHTHPAGIGGFVGLHPDPNGEIHARRLRAQVVIRVKADTMAGLGSAESAVANALLTADRTHLRSQGIFRIVRDTGFGPVYAGADAGLTVAAGKDLRFDIDFEYRRLPDAPAGVIGELPLDLLLQATDAEARLLYGADFAVDPLAAFAAFDDAPVTNGPGDWQFDAGAGRLEQTSLVGGGSNAFNPSKRGTYLVLRPSVVPRLPGDWILHAEMGADSGGLGLVFNFRDIDNFHFFIMSRPTPYRFLGRKAAGAFGFLDVGGQDNGNAYEPGEHRIRLAQQNGELRLAIDNAPVLTARENVPPSPGSVGFLCRNCATARFRSLRWVGL
jgi:hypothetical protein